MHLLLILIMAGLLAGCDQPSADRKEHRQTISRAHTEILDSTGFLRPYAVSAMYNGNVRYFLSGNGAEVAAKVGYLLAFANALNRQCGLLSREQVDGLDLLHVTYGLGAVLLADKEALEAIARESAIGAGDSLLFVERYACQSRTAHRLAHRLY